jgi:hypothetical protein
MRGLKNRGQTTDMKSPQCKTRWHKHCIDPECDCEHHAIYSLNPEAVTKVKFDPVNYATIVIDTIPPQGPPPHPEPFDHGVWRVAEEPPGTDRLQPWVLDYCLYCSGPTWTHNARVAERHETVCEGCAFLMLEELTGDRVKRETRQARVINDPFK